MRKLALNDEILLKIEKPARYIGGEYNSVMKDPEKVDVRFAMCFPDVYEIGMSHLGIQILYDMFNRREDVWCERVYSPWVRSEEHPNLDGDDPLLLQCREQAFHRAFPGPAVEPPADGR